MRGYSIRTGAISLALGAFAIFPTGALAAPSLGTPIVSKVTTESAHLEASIGTNGKTTSYHFEYGLADCASNPCTATPVPDAKISGAIASAKVSAELEGLTAGTTYHFRVVAKSDATVATLDRTFHTAATPPHPEQVFASCPNDTFRVEHPSGKLPDCRAYEQASPVDKNGLDAIGQVPWDKASPDGARVSFLTTDGMPGGEGAQELPAYLASRDPFGWSTQGMLPPATLGPQANALGWSPDLSRVFGYVSTEFNSGEAAFLQRSSADGSLTSIVPFGSGLDGKPQFAGSTPDGSEVLFESTSQLLPGATAGRSNVYLWDSGTGQLHLASALNDGKTPVQGAFAGAYDWMAKKTPVSFPDHGTSYVQDTHAISSDGSLYFTEAETGRLYLRRNPTVQQSQLDGEGKCTEADKACTQLVSASHRSVPDPAGSQPAAFMAATPDGSRALFTSSQKLTDDATTGPAQDAPMIVRSDSEGNSIEAGFLPATAAGMTIDSEHIYWADPVRGTIGRAKLGPSGPEQIEPEYVVPGETKAINHPSREPSVFHFAPSRPRYVAVGGEYLYWTNTGPLGEVNGSGSNVEIVAKAGTIGRARIGPSEAEDVKPEFITGASNPQGIAVNSEHIYWANAGVHFNEGTIARAGIDGEGVNQAFISSVFPNEHPQGLAINSAHIVWIATEPNGSETERNSYLRSAELSGANPAGRFIDNGLGVRGIALDAGYVYWASEVKGTIGRIALADALGPSGVCEEIPSCDVEFVKGQGKVLGLARDAFHLYWSENGEPRPNPGNDLYRYDVDTGNLTDIAPDPGDENGAEVLGVLGASDDGSYVYFAANGDLDGAGPATPGNCAGSAAAFGIEFSGTCNLYLSHAGTIEFIARLDAGGDAQHSDALDWTPRGAIGSTLDSIEKASRVTPDGLTLLFRSQGRLTAYDNEGVAELYRYRVGEAGPTCVSCNPTGVAPSDIPTAGVNVMALEPNRPAYTLSRILSSDGDRVFFASTDPLVLGDVNGEEGCPPSGSMWSSPPICQDVYEWEAKGTGSCEEDVQGGGCLYLLSNGRSPYPSFFVDASTSGGDAFLITRSQLVPQDQDGLYDVYDTRAGGGLAAQNAVPPVPCEGEACKPGAATPPAISSPVTPSFSGPPDPKPSHGHKRKRRGAKKASHGKHQRHHTKTTRRKSR